MPKHIQHKLLYYTS